MMKAQIQISFEYDPSDSVLCSDKHTQRMNSSSEALKPLEAFKQETGITT